jgi:hypothetical protein
MKGVFWFSPAGARPISYRWPGLQTWNGSAPGLENGS